MRHISDCVGPFLVVPAPLINPSVEFNKVLIPYIVSERRDEPPFVFVTPIDRLEISVTGPVVNDYVSRVRQIGDRRLYLQYQNL